MRLGDGGGEKVVTVVPPGGANVVGAAGPGMVGSDGTGNGAGA